MNNSTKRIPSLDGLRAVSIFLVLFDHFSYYAGRPVNTFSFGNLGVRVFFIISGFLITSILASEIEKNSVINIKKFYFRRLLRIFPAYYFYILFILVLTGLGFYDNSFSDFIIPLTFTSNYLSAVPIEFVHTWSLSVEEQFYIFLPGIIFICGLEKTKKFLLFAFFVAPILRVLNINALMTSGEFEIPTWFLFGFHTNIDVLVTGCLLALNREKLHLNRLYNYFLNSTKIFLTLPILIIFITSYYKFTYAFLGVGMTIVNVSVALCVDWLIVNHQKILGRILNSPPFKFIGVMSYSLYLWQQPFINYSENVPLTYFPLNIILMILLSLLSYYIIERRFLRWRQVWEKNLESRNLGFEKPIEISN